MQHVENVYRAATLIQEKTQWLQPGSQGKSPDPLLGLVLGTGLGGVRERIDADVVLEYTDIPGFPSPSVAGHSGRLVCGRLGGTRVICLCGRVHLYEGRSPNEVCFGVRVLGALGVTALVLTNAAGGLNPDFTPGTLMMASDHINMTGQSPLTGPNEARWGVRFPDMSRVYDPGLHRALRRSGERTGAALETGVLVQVSGPQMETPAETRAFRILGGDAVGMSTVLEAVAAKHMGLAVAVVSCITNVNIPECMAEISLEQVIDQAGQSGDRLADLLEDLAASLGPTKGNH